MRRLDYIEKVLTDRWGRSPVVDVCNMVLEYAASKAPECEITLTFGDFKSISGLEFDNTDLQNAIALLVSRFDVLELKFVFFDDDDAAIYLDHDEQRHFLETGTLVHPVSGETVENGGSRTYPYYIARPAVLLEEVS